MLIFACESELGAGGVGERGLRCPVNISWLPNNKGDDSDCFVESTQIISKTCWKIILIGTWRQETIKFTCKKISEFHKVIIPLMKKIIIMCMQCIFSSDKIVVFVCTSLQRLLHRLNHQDYE